MSYNANWDNLPEIDIPDMKRKIFTGENVMLVRNVIRPHAVLDAHSHPHEQMLYVLDGNCDVTIGEEKFSMKTGDMALVPGGMMHQVTATGEGELTMLDIFSPIREDFLK